MTTETYKSNVHGRLKAKGKILKLGDKIEINPEELKTNEDLKALVVTRQLIRDHE